ncbi:MAG: RagB/SusD family nutrient uptake outer membrane protein [Dysgonomonas sp.]
MKTKLLLMALLAAALVSCNDFLNYDENSDYTKKGAFDTYSRAFQTATYVYSYLPSDYLATSSSDNLLGGASRSAGCDEAEYVWPTSSVHTFYNGTWSATNTVDDQWGRMYAGIRAANVFLENGVGLTFPEEQYAQDYKLNMRIYNNLQWEMRFLRAYYHFELLKRYNNIPVVEKVMTPEEANNVEQVPFDSVVEFIVKECDIAKQHLPIVYDSLYSLETGRATKAAAMALKSRVLLYAASKLHNPEHDQQKWIRAAQAAKALIDSAAIFGVSSLPAYASVASTDNFALAEVIFAARRDNSNSPERYNFPIGFEGGNTGNCPTQNLADCYGMMRGKVYDPQNPFTSERDPRLMLNVVADGTLFCYNSKVDISEGSPNGLPTNGATKTGYYLKKFLNKDVSLTSASTTSSRHTFPLFRFAEVYLNYAEAMVEAYGDWNTTDNNLGLNMTALASLNKVRARGGLGLAGYLAADVTSVDDFTAKLRKERMAELAFEDHRFWDIRRWKIGPETTKIIRLKIVKDAATNKNKYSTYETNDRVWEDRMYFYPIPQTEIFKNPKLKQNPGW